MVANVEAAAWEALLEMEGLYLRSGQEDEGIVSIVVNIANACEKVQQAGVWQWSSRKWSACTGAAIRQASYDGRHIPTLVFSARPKPGW